MEEGERGKIVIYWNYFDLCLGIVLMVLTVFFMNDYLVHQSERYNYGTNVELSQFLDETDRIQID